MTQIKHKFGVTSDWHIGHKNCLKFDDRPFRDLDHMHTVLANNINSSIGIHDILYVLGDCGLSKSGELKSFMERLNPFTKVLITGNHDKGANAMKGMGFDVVLHSAQFHIMNVDVTMSHCPPMEYLREDCSKFDRPAPDSKYWHGDHKNQKYSVTYDKTKLHLHGHTHKKPGPEVRVDNVWDIGVVGNEYRPVMKSAIESHIAKLKKEGVL